MDWVDLLAELKQRNIRLSVQGDNLQYQAPRGSLTPDLVAALKQQRHQLIALLAKLGQNDTAILPNKDNAAPLTAAQKQIWASYFIQANQKLNHIPSVVDINHGLSSEAIINALKRIQQKHDALKLRFRYAGSAIQQYIEETTDQDWISVIEEDDLQGQTEDFIERRFDLLKQMPHRVMIIERNRQPVRCIWCFHHLIMDGWSMSLLIGELISWLRDGTDAATSGVRFIDYAASSYAAADTTPEALGFWKRYLSNIPTHALTIESTPFPEVSHTFKWVIANEEYAQVQSLAHKHNVPASVVLLSLYQMLIYCFSHCQRFALKMPVAGRNGPGLDHVLGLFANQMLVKCEVEDDTTLAELIQLTQRNLTQAMAHAEVPTGVICKQVNASPVEAFNEFGFAYYRDFSDQFCFQPIRIGDALVTPVSYSTKTSLHHSNLALFESKQEILAELTVTETLTGKELNEAGVKSILQHFLVCLQTHSAMRLAEAVVQARANLPHALFARSKKTTAAPQERRGHSHPIASRAVLEKIIQANLMEIWELLLQHSIKDADADFFELGGNSLMVAELHQLIQSRLKINFDARGCFKHTTLRSQAAYLAELMEAG